MSAGRGVALRAAVAAAAAAMSCAPSGASLPPSPQRAEVVMRHLGFAFDPSPLRAGRIVFDVRNGDDDVHDLVLVPLPESVPPLREQLASDERAAVAIVAAIPEQDPGERESFAADLDRGRYGILCFVEGDGGRAHALDGMFVEFRIP